MQKILAAVIMMGAIATIASCSKSLDPGPNSLFGNFDQTTMLTNVGNNVLLTGINDLTSGAAAAQTAINLFALHPNTTTLVAAQTTWTAVALNWAASSPFNIGPMYDNLISPTIDTWPANPTKIENAITAGTAATSAGADAKGLKGLEYLLFGKNGNDAVVSKYKNSDSTKRKAWLNSVAADLVSQTSALKNDWTTGYSASFASSDGNDVSSSVSQVVNAIALYLDAMRNQKLGDPIGMGTKVNDNQAHPDLIEYTLAEESIATMKANLVAMKAVFDGGTGQGLDDLLNYVKAQKNSQNLSAVVDAQFDDAINKVNAIAPPFAGAVSSQKQQVEDAFNSVKLLITSFKVDVANNLGVTITFTDTDGD